MTLVAVAAIALLAFFVQGLTGFGAALVLAPLLLLVLDLHTSVAASAIVQVLVGAGLTYQARAAIDRRSLAWLLPSSIVGLALGTLALTGLETDWLRRLCGALTVLVALDLLRRTLLRIRARGWPAWAGVPAGLVSGVLGGLFGTSGPPAIAYLEGRLERGAALRGTLLGFFLIFNSLRVIGYGAAAMLDRPVATIALAMLPAAIVGALLGSRLQRRASERGFRLAVAGVLLATGAALLR